MRGRTWLERDGDMPIFSAKNSEEYKIVELFLEKRFIILITG